MNITVKSIRVPAWSTIGYGSGTDEQGRLVSFIGDHRPMRHLGESLVALTRAGTQAPQVELETWQIMSIREETRS